jgi:hypothetical protein
MPIRYRRLLLALPYLQHLVAAPNHQLIAAALKECLKLTRLGHENWLSSLRSILGGLPFYVQTPLFTSMPTADEIKHLIEDVTSGINKMLLREIQASEKPYLIRGRLENGDPPREVGMLSRQYMTVANLNHRRAITRIATSNHPLAIEALRHVRPKPSRGQRKCRFCTQVVETPEHGLLECAELLEIASLRAKFARELVERCETATLNLVANGQNSAEQLRTLIHKADSVKVVARYSYKVLTVVDEYPLYRPMWT